jgi:AmmeMemoRadiSam system protein A
MSILEAFTVPHPPILVPGVGHGQEYGAQPTLDAYEIVARRIAELAPELLILTTSHGELYRNALRISTGAGAQGDFADFRDPDDQIEVSFDEQFIAALITEAKQEGLPFSATPEPGNRLDHGCLVPLHFISQHLKTPFKVARIAISFLDEQTHYRMGQCIARAVDTLDRRTVFVASGDLSHRLKEDGPYGFHEAGPRFDQAVCEAFATGDFEALMHFDAHFRDEAAECGLNSFIIMAGALDGRTVESELLSYEGPWGVGYGIARFTPTKQAKDAEQDGGTVATTETDKPAGTPSFASSFAPSLASSSSHALPVRLAFAALADWLAGTGKPSAKSPHVTALLDSLDDADGEMLAELRSRRAGAFVSFHKGEHLRGCIGTISATCDNIFEEICQNTVSAAGSDPRFPAIQADEVSALHCSVDVLGEAEPVASTSELDAKRYGVIVSKGFRRGLLLPDLEGVDTPQEQIAIALSKAGIAPDASYDLERFEVVRYE